jgi:tetratricopeptide (TPR) repeat protein
LAGSYLARYRYAAFGSPVAYLTDLRRADFLDHTSLIKGEHSPTGHDLHVFNTFALSWGKLDSANPVDETTRRALVCASCFAAGEPIPRELLKASMGVKVETIELDRLVEDAFGRALELGLLEERADGALALHRLLGAFIRGEAGSELASALDAVEQTVMEIAARLNEEGCPARLALWRSHLRAIAEAAAERGSARARRLLNELGYHLRMVAEFADARMTYERALAIDEKVYGPEHPTVAVNVNNLGNVLQALGELAGARKAYGRALLIDERVYGREHPNVAKRVNNIGSVLRDLGELAEARAAFDRALVIDEKVYGPEHPKVAIRLNNVGEVLRELGDLGGARAAYERVLAIFKARLPADHPNIRIVQDNLESLNLKKASETS